jgi:S1-C subfamily serine protease
VIPDSPAERAGVHAGDVITTVAGRDIESNTDLRDAIGLSRVGDEVTIDLLRDGRRERRHAILADTLHDAPAPVPGRSSGKPQH